MEMIVIW
jgi:hypothetical protein